MVLEADGLGCAEEVIVIAAALSIQDPRERPAEQRRQADAVARALRRSERSDFLAFLNLWRYVREQQRELSGNQFRKRCKGEYLHVLRIREWQDLVGQLRQAAKAAGVHRSTRRRPSPTRSTARCWPACCRTSALRDAGAGREYLGARGARFAIFPGSALAQQPAGLGHGRRAGRDVAAVGADRARASSPRGSSRSPAHLVRRTYERAALGPQRGARSSRRSA